MSDKGQDNSLITNLKNKVSYNLHKATYDPEANKFAEEQIQKKKEQVTEQAKTTEETKQSDSDPNKFNVKRFITKIGNQTYGTLKKVFFPFLALMLAMIVTNEMIIYSVPIRIIFFVFTLILCIFVPYITILLGFYYVLKGGYSYWVNNMTSRPKTNIMPTIFALLPITTYKPLSTLGAFFMYPFTYPKTEQDAIKLPEIMKDYWGDLQKSFPDLDKVKNIPNIADGLKKIQENFTHLHSIKEQAADYKTENKIIQTV